MSKSKAPTGLSIARNGSTFTFSWKKGDSDYENGQSDPPEWLVKKIAQSEKLRTYRST